MASRDLKIRYPKPSTQAAINAAIRAELVGGDDVLAAAAALSSLRHAWKQRGWTDHAPDIEAAHAAVGRILTGFRAEIRRRYEMPPEPRRHED